jgi:hypothetical protein
VNNDLFKKFIAPFVHEMIERLGRHGDVSEMHAQMPEPIVHFIAGGVYGLISEAGVTATPWRDEPLTPGAKLNLSQEEVRRTLDFVRLHLETWSATS